MSSDTRPISALGQEHSATCRRVANCKGCPDLSEGACCPVGPVTLAPSELVISIVTLPRHMQLFRQGEEVRFLYVVCSGYVKLSVDCGRGQQMVIQIAGPGSMLGLSSAFFQSAFEVSAEAITEVSLKAVDRKGFLKYVKAQSEIQARALQSLARSYDSALLGASRLGGMRPASERIGNLLLVLGQQVGYNVRGAEVAFPLLLTHGELGVMAATTRETVSRILTQFRKQGWISLDAGWITIHHPENLRDPEFLQNNRGRGNSRVRQDFVTVNQVFAAREAEMPLVAA